MSYIVIKGLTMHFDFNVDPTQGHSLSTKFKDKSKTVDNNSEANKTPKAIEPGAINKTLAKDEINISNEAKEKLEEEVNESIGKTSAKEKKSPTELADEMKQKLIDDLKKRIKKLSEELQKVQDKQDEGSIERAKLLQGQINDLNGALLTIMTS